MGAICLKARHLVPEDFSEFGWADKPSEVLSELSGYMFPMSNPGDYVRASVMLVGSNSAKSFSGAANESDWRNMESRDSVVLVAAKRIARENEVELGELLGAAFDPSELELIFVFRCS